MDRRHTPIVLKSRREIDLMRKSGILLQRVLREVCGAVAPGVSTLELDRIARARIQEGGGKPSFLRLYGFPNTLCVSVNEEIVHGIPSAKRVLKEGDVVSVDCGVNIGGWHADAAWTVPVGEVGEDVRKLLRVTRECLDLAIAASVANNRLGDIGWAVQEHAEANGFHVVENYGGHGIGKKVHEDPRVENIGPPKAGKRLQPGMVLAIEPMIAMGTSETEELSDEWTVVTADGSFAAHYEHTVAITEAGPEILTLPGPGSAPLP